MKEFTKGAIYGYSCAMIGTLLWVVLAFGCSEQSSESSGDYCKLIVENITQQDLEIHKYPEGEVMQDKHIDTLKAYSIGSYRLKEYTNYSIMIFCVDLACYKGTFYIQTLGKDYVFKKRVY